MSLFEPFAFSPWRAPRGAHVFVNPADVWALWRGVHQTLFTIQCELVCNFLHIALIPWLDGVDVQRSSSEEGHAVIEVERDGRVGIDLKFGSITFEENATGSFAVALVDVLVGGPAEAGTRVQMEVKVAADPEHDSILGVTEMCRAHIVSTLRAAADKFDATTARALLYQAPARTAAE